VRIIRHLSHLVCSSFNRPRLFQAQSMGSFDPGTLEEQSRLVATYVLASTGHLKEGWKEWRVLAVAPLVLFSPSQTDLYISSNKS